MATTFPRKILKIFLISLLIGNTALGLDAKYLPIGTPAPFEGYLLTVPKAKEIRQQLIEADDLKVLNTSLNKSLVLQKEITTLTEDKVKLVSDQNDKLAKSLMDERSVSSWERLIWFSLGIIGTGVAVWSIKKIQ